MIGLSRLLLRQSSHLSPTDAERESFKVFTQLSKSSAHKQSAVDEIVNELLTMSLAELHQLSVLLNDQEFLKKIKSENTFPVQTAILPKNRSPFPHPKHLFAGIDADQRPGMHTVPQK